MYLFNYISGIEVEKIVQYFRFYSVPAPSNPDELRVFMYRILLL